VGSTPRRPFYTAFAWAYDLLIAGPVSSRCDFIEHTLVQRGGVLPGARLLNAGCGTGSYAIELARRGYRVTGVDVEPALLLQARTRAADLSASLTIETGDILDLPPDRRYEAILCRGVLNDLVADADRVQAFFSFARALDAGRVLILDVREWNATICRYRQEPIFERSVDLDDGTLTFRSVTHLEPDTRRLLVSERHTLVQGGVETTADHDFVMRCWEKEELAHHLARAGFGAITYAPDYALAPPVDGIASSLWPPGQPGLKKGRRWSIAALQAQSSMI